MSKPNRYCYPAVFGRADGEEVSVVFPDLDAATSGNDEADALASARELLICVLTGLAADGADFPAPTPLCAVTISDNERAVPVEVVLPSPFQKKE